MMTEFYQEDYRIRSVRIGEQSSLPGLEGLANVQQNTKAVLDEDDEIFLGYGFRSNVFPYRPQDVYTREQTERCYRSIVLENEFLRARFLPELGGRLISLTDKASGRDLLYQNKTLYAGNLAMRNSWFSGGVEWNASIIGHNPFTCSPLFAARTQLADGTPVLRMYEYERLRGVSFQMDFFLPDGSRVLFARMRLVNENAQTVPTYWWSNIAVPEWRGGRVVVPADAAYVARDGVIFKDSVPVDRGGDDVTYPVNNPKAVDHFWKIAPERRKYIAHLNADGWGLVQASTHRQRGRKLFVWGQTRGSARWQEFLSGNPHDRYIEIQAGLAQTQYECLPMPPHTAWEWLEAYGAMNAGPAQIHGAWHGAQAAVEARLETLIPQERLEQLLRQTRDTMAKRPAQALFCRGSGWGALENLRRAHAGEPPLSPQLDFGVPGAEQAPWRALLERGAMGEYDPREPVSSWLPDARYLPLLAQAAQGAERENWHTWLQLGAALLTQGRFADARDALARADSLARCAWVKYACSCLHLMQHEPERAAVYARQAAEAAPEDASVLKFALRVLLEARQYGEALRLIAAAPPELQRLPRVRLSEAQALVGLERLEEAEAILLQDGGLIVPDIREGEQTMSEVWLALQQKKYGLGREAAEKIAPVPYRMDFRMT